MENNISSESTKGKTQKFWNITFYAFAFFPMVFIIALLAFYIHAGFISEYKNLSGINLFGFKLLDLYQYSIICSWVGSVFSFLPFLIIVFLYYIKFKKAVTWKPILITLVIYFIALALVFSSLFEFAFD